MKNWSNEVKVGLFIIGVLGVLFYLTFNVGGKRMFSTKGQQSFYVYFDSITGVTEKSEVRMAGVKIGEVKKIALDNYRAKVIVDLTEAFSIPDDSVAKVQGKGLLGEKYVEIVPGVSTTFVPNGGELKHSVSPVNLEDIVTKLGGALDDIKSVTESLKDSLGTSEGKQGLKSIISNLAALSADLQSVVGGNKDRLNSIIANVDKATSLLQTMLAENRDNLRGTIENANKTLKSFSDKTPELLAHLDQAATGIRDMLDENRQNVKEGISNIKDAGGNINGMLAENRDNFRLAMVNLKNSSEKLDKIMDNVKQISGKLEKGEGTIGRLIQEDGLYNNLNDTLESTGSLAKKVENLKIGVGARLERQTDAQRTKAYFSLRIKPREDKYYMIEVTEDIRRPVAQRNTLNALLYTFYIAKRYGNVTLKGGLIESTAGLGLDLHGWDDKLELNVETYNFSGYDTKAPSMQAKITGKYHFQKYWYLYLGGDELLNEYYRTFYGGIGIMADEDDFKFFLGRLF